MEINTIDSSSAVAHSDASLSDSDPAWYLVQCKPRQDRRAEENLDRQGYRCFRPMCTRERVVCGRLQLITESLFPGYLFINLFHDSGWAPLRSTRGVSHIVSFGGAPLAVRNETISQFRTAKRVDSLLLLSEKANIFSSEQSSDEIAAIFCTLVGEQRTLLLLKMLERTGKKAN